MLEIVYNENNNRLNTLSDKFPEAARAAKEAKINEALMLLEREIKLLTPYGAGPIHLRDSIHSQMHSGDPMIGILGTPMQHGEPVEMGTKPHFPPIEPLAFWVERKLGYHGDEAKGVAFAIARKMSRKGTKGANMFAETYANNESRVQGILAEIADDIVARLS